MSAGQPLFAEDTWLHLALGRAYLAHGPWLTADPLLHTAAVPPAPAAWLFDVALHGLEQIAGFQGLRIAHALGVACILALAWGLLRRASGSPAFASLGTAVFAAASAYRLFQLRPDLFTILATLLLHWLIAEAPLSRGKLLAIAGLFALWVNLHGGFVLGLALLGAAVAGHTAAAIGDPRLRPGAVRLAAATGCALLATLANPAFTDPHLLYFRAGVETPALEMVRDEWARFPLLELPVANVPPSPLSWGLTWALLLSAPIAGAVLLRRRRSEAALVAMAAVSLVGLVSAVRLGWLVVTPLLVLGRSPSAVSRRTAIGWAAASAAIAPAFLLWGDWPMISRGIHRDLYAEPYAAGKYETHAVWFLRDAGLEGRLYNDYASANFLGYWLAPRLTAFVNGSLNVPIDAMRAWQALGRRSGVDGEDFGELLDRYGVDVFFGTGLPVLGASARPAEFTTTHLERDPDWVTVFRTPRGAVYLRRGERNAGNLARVVAYYERERISFDPEAGFDPERVIARSPRWAVEHGVAPFGLPALTAAASAFGSSDPGPREAARDGLAELHAVLGSYGRAVAMDRQDASASAGSPAAPSYYALAARRRRVWSSLHLREIEESLQAAEELRTFMVPGDRFSELLISAAQLHAELPEDEAAALVALLPLLAPADAPRIMSGFVSAEARRH